MLSIGNVFLVRGCEKTIIQIQETDAVAESAASQNDYEGNWLKGKSGRNIAFQYYPTQPTASLRV